MRHARRVNPRGSVLCLRLGWLGGRRRSQREDTRTRHDLGPQIRSFPPNCQQNPPISTRLNPRHSWNAGWMTVKKSRSRRHLVQAQHRFRHQDVLSLLPRATCRMRHSTLRPLMELRQYIPLSSCDSSISHPHDPDLLASISPGICAA